MAGQAGFFDLDERYAGLSASGDPLERLSRVVDFEIFREDLERALKRSERRRGGRQPMDAVMMFKVLVLQALRGHAPPDLARCPIRRRMRAETGGTRGQGRKSGAMDSGRDPLDCRKGR